MTTAMKECCAALMVVVTSVQDLSLHLPHLKHALSTERRSTLETPFQLVMAVTGGELYTHKNYVVMVECHLVVLTTNVANVNVK